MHYPSIIFPCLNPGDFQKVGMSRYVLLHITCNACIFMHKYYNSTFCTLKLDLETIREQASCQNGSPENV